MTYTLTATVVSLLAFTVLMTGTLEAHSNRAEAVSCGVSD